ncbi:MAG: ABC transporter permease [Deltaproteobacteria bacterium]|nr:ABC transporter permease [Deltaproteobacteria bacterium]
MVDLARKNLLHDKLRFLITVSGVAFAVTLVLVQVGLFFGILENATITIEHLGADLWVTSKNTPTIDFPHAFPESHVHRVRGLPGVARADNLIVGYMNLALPTGAEETAAVYALEDFAAWNFPWKVAEGDVRDLRRGRYFFLDDSAAKRFGAFKVGEYREVMGQRLKLIGRTQEARSFTTTPIAFMDYRLAQQLSPTMLGGRAPFILVKLGPGADLAAVRAEIARRLPHHDVLTSAEWAARCRHYWIVNTGLGFNMFLTVFLGCLVGVVVVAQTLYTSTMEHLKEFGTVKAIGGSNGLIYGILTRQALIAAVFGFVLGAIPSYLLRPLVLKVDLKLIIGHELAALVFVGTVLMCLGASLISFRKVAGIDPALVFRG